MTKEGEKCQRGWNEQVRDERIQTNTMSVRLRGWRKNYVKFFHLKSRIFLE